MKTKLSSEEALVRRTLVRLGYDAGDLSDRQLRGACLELEAFDGSIDHAEVVVLLIARHELRHFAPRHGDVVPCVGCQRPIIHENDWVLEGTLVMHPRCLDRFAAVIARA